MSTASNNYGFFEYQTTDTADLTQINQNFTAIDNGLGLEPYAADSGAANAYVVTLAPVPKVYAAGLKFSFKAANANTGASTINPNGLGAKTIKKGGTTDLAAGDIPAGAIIKIEYDGTYFQMAPIMANMVALGSATPNMDGTGASGSASTAARSDHVHPTDTSRAAASDLTTHLADYVRQPGYGSTAGGTTVYTLTLSPAPTAYTDGMGIAIKMNAANTGASTINVNGLGAKSLKDPNGNDFASGTLKQNTIYSFKYDSVSGNFILQGKGGGGNATADQLLSGQTATVDSGPITGTMPNRGATNLDPSTSNQNIPAGYYNGSGIINAVAHGTQTWSTAGTYTWTVPKGINQLFISMRGGGGGGGSVYFGPGSGGGQGGKYEGFVNVTEGQVLTVVVGNGGAGGPFGSNGSDGGSSSVAGATAAGGHGGLHGADQTNQVGQPGGTGGGTYGSNGASGGNSTYSTMTAGVGGGSGVGAGGNGSNGGGHNDGYPGTSGSVSIQY